MATLTKNPTGDAAFAGTWSQSVNRYTWVDDYPDSGGTDFLTHGTTAGTGTFTFPAFSVPTGSTAISVQILWYDRKNASQGNNIKPYLGVGNLYYVTGSFAPVNGTWTQRTQNFPSNPRTGLDWTVNDVNGSGTNALQAFGWVSTDASPSIDLSSILLQVTYTPPADNIVGAGGIASAGAIGSPSASVDIVPSGIASAGAFGSLTLTMDVISAGGIASAEAIGLPTIAEAAAPDEIVGAGGIASAEAVGSPSASLGITAAGISSSEALGQPTISYGITTAGISSSETIGQPSASVDIAFAGGISSQEALGQPGIALGVSTIGISSAEAVGQPSLATTIATSGVQTSEAFGLATVTTEGVDYIVGVGGIGSAESAGNPTISIDILPQGISSGESFGNSSISTDISPVGIVSAEAFGLPVIAEAASYDILGVGGIISSESFGQPTVSEIVIPKTIGIIHVTESYWHVATSTNAYGYSATTSDVEYE